MELYVCIWLKIQRVDLLCKQVEPFVCFHLLHKDRSEIGPEKLFQILNCRLETVIDDVKSLLVLIECTT